MFMRTSEIVCGRPTCSGAADWTVPPHFRSARREHGPGLDQASPPHLAGAFIDLPIVVRIDDWKMQLPCAVLAALILGALNEGVSLLAAAPDAEPEILAAVDGLLERVLEPAQKV